MAWLEIDEIDIEYRPDPAGELVAQLSQDQLDRVIYGRR